MKTDPSPKPSPVSEAKLKANRANAQLSPGPTPTGKARTRFNARKHGLSARMVLPGQDTPKNQEFRRRARARLGPRNPIEEDCVVDLLRSRFREDLFLEVEQTVLTRKPVSLTSGIEQSYPFLHEPTALRTLEQMARHLAHLSRAAEKDFLALLRVRRENWGLPSQGASTADSEEECAITTECQQGADPPPLSTAALEDCLADKRLILPGEDSQLYEAHARELWATFQPSNILEEFVTCDFIQAKWRLERVLRIECTLLERCAVSATGDNCGVGFAFIHDSQRNQALESLRHYETVLRKRIEKRMALWRKLRKEGWEDAVLPSAQPPAAPQSSGIPARVSNSAPQPVSGPTPNLVPTPVLVTSSLEPADPALGQPANAGSVSQCCAKATPRDCSTGT